MSGKNLSLFWLDRNPANHSRQRLKWLLPMSILGFLIRNEDGHTLRVVLEEVQKTKDSENEEDDDFEGISITYKEKDSGEENEW